ncbi:MAG: helix-turn-helix domain-containing protein, partial [Anaeromyxobacteraceae bacterium]
ETELIDVGDLPRDVVARSEKSATAAAPLPEELTLAQALESTERAMLLEARRRHGNQTRMAEALGVDQSTVARKLKKYGIG